MKVFLWNFTKGASGRGRYHGDFHGRKVRMKMDRGKLERSRKWLQEELERSVAFWLKYGMDPVNGGVYTCLDRKGEI